MGRRHARVVVGDAEALELALLVEVVHGLERHLVWRRAVGAVQVEDVDGAVARGGSAHGAVHPAVAGRTLP